jgi:hypothetical protein
VLCDQPVPGLQIRGFQHCPNLIERHVKIAKSSDYLRNWDLRGGIPPVARVPIDIGRLKQPDPVIVAQRFDTHMTSSGEVTYRQRRLHGPSLHTPVRGESRIGANWQKR